MGAAHRQHLAQSGGEREHDQQQAEGGGDTGADEDPGVVQGPFGELPGQCAAPVHRGPLGADGGDVVEQDARAGQQQDGDDASGDAARRPEAAALAVAVVDDGNVVVGCGGIPAVSGIGVLLDDR